MRYRIELFRDAQWWMVRSDDPEVLQLFGTDIIPTPFTAAADERVVLHAIRRLNPDRDVYILGELRRAYGEERAR